MRQNQRRTMETARGRHKNKKRSEYIFIVVYVFLLTFLVVILCAGVYYAGMSRYLRKQIETDNANYLNQLSSSYELFLENTVSSSMLFIENNTRNVMSLYQDEDAYKKQMYRHLEAIAHSTGFIDSVYFFDRDTEIVYLSSGVAYEIGDFYDGPWLDSLKETDRTWEILSARQLEAPLESRKNIVPILIRYPFTAMDSPYLYVINLRAEELFRYLADSESGSEERKYKVLNDSRNIFISSDSGDNFRNIEDFPYLWEHMQDIESESQGYFITENEGRRLFVGHVYSSRYGWLYLSEIDYDQVLGQLREPLLLMLAVTGVMLAVSMLLGIFFSRRLYRPVKSLSDLLKDTISRNDAILKRQFGYNLLARNYYSQEEIDRYMEELQIDPEGDFVVAVFAVDDKKHYLEAFDGQEQALWEYACENVAGEIAGEYGKSIFAGVDSGRFAVIFTFDDPAWKENPEGAAREAAGKIAEVLRQFIRFTFSAGIGTAVSGICRAGLSFEQAGEAIRFLEGAENEIITFREMQTENRKLRYSYENEENLMEIVKSGDGGTAGEFLQSMYEEFCLGNNTQKDGPLFFSFLIVTAIMKQGNELGLSYEETFGGHSVTALWESGGARRDEKEMISLLREIVEALCDRISAMREGVTNSQVLLITQFIREHYKEAITLGDIAEHAGVNQSTVSRLMKQNLKISTVDYINQVRIAKAMELIEQHSFGTVAEIAGETGFHNTHYFIRVFKKIIGKTPGNVIEEKSRES